MNKYNSKGINFFIKKKMIGKSLGKIIEQLLLMVRMVKKKSYVLSMFQNIA